MPESRDEAKVLNLGGEGECEGGQSLRCDGDVGRAVSEGDSVSDDAKGMAEGYIRTVRRRYTELQQR